MKAASPCNPVHPSRGFTGGFTFLELLVAIFVLSLVLGLSLPSFTNWGEERVLAEAKRIASIVRMLHESGVTTRETLSFRVDFARGSIQYEGTDGEKAETFGTVYAVRTPSRGMVNEGELTIFFGPSGATEGFRVQLKSGEKGLAVIYNPLSGRVKIEEEQG